MEIKTINVDINSTEVLNPQKKEKEPRRWNMVREQFYEDVSTEQDKIAKFHFDDVQYKYWEEDLGAPKGALSYCDSSIWCFNDRIWGKDGLRSSDVQIQKYIDQKRYELVLSREYILFAQKKLRNSFIGKVDEHGQINAHADSVCPFVFHSEGNLCRGLTVGVESEDKELYALRSFFEKYEWKVLLVDDHATNGLATIDENNSTLGKIKFIVYDLIDLLGASDKNGEVKINIESVSSVEAAFNQLKDGYRYDIILLDYKFDNASGKDRYGTNLLSRIQESKEIQPCPAGKYNFLFVSGYPDAVHDSMMADGIYSDTDRWFVRRGACPINTPYLFLYELVRLMEHRVKPLREHVDMVQNNNKTKSDAEKLTGPTAFEFISWLFSDGNVRDKCKNSFNAFLTLRATYDKIKYDVFDDKQKGKDGFVDIKEKESRLIRNMFPDVVCYSNTFWEHMQHLVYLTAYGTNRQWSEMWEELMCVSMTLEAAEKKLGKSPRENDGVVSLIRKYILGLKNGKY